jgi:cystathionine beta-lyase
MAESRALSASTRLIHAGGEALSPQRTVNPPIEKGSTVIMPNAAALYDHGQITYGRGGLGVQATLRRALETLENASAVRLFPSGLAALTGVMLAVLKAGDEILVTDGVYNPTRRFCNRVLSRYGISTRYYPPGASPQAVMSLTGPSTRLIVLESPASLTFEMVDAPAIARLARAAGILTLMDNTWAAGLLFKPLDHGIDLSVQALTKYVGGHSDAFMGSAATRRADLTIALDEAIVDVGWAVSPEDAYQMLRGLRTLSARMDRHGQSAVTVAAWLQRQPQVRSVLFPALEGAPGCDVWRRDYVGAAGLFSFVLDPAWSPAVTAFLDGLELFGLGFSWGGFESLALNCDPQFDSRTTPPRLPGPSIRLSIGLEDPADLIGDLEAAFALASGRIMG